MMRENLCDLSVVLIAVEGYMPLRETIQHLRAQTVASRLEIVLVVPERASLEIDETDFDVFGAYQLVEIGRFRSIGQAMAAGARAAATAIVAFGEDHAFPEPEWAAALLDAFCGPWAAVGYMMSNANPTPIGWADMLLNFGPWIAPGVGQEMDHLAPHNTAYRRAILMSLGEALDNYLEAEASLPTALRGQGYRLYFEPRAHIYHVNMPHWAALIKLHLNGGRTYSTVRWRANAWPVWKRLLYVLASPLLPLVRLMRLTPHLQRTGWSGLQLLTILSPLLAALLAHTLGEAQGYLFGAGTTMTQRLDLYHARTAYLARSSPAAADLSVGVTPSLSIQNDRKTHKAK